MVSLFADGADAEEVEVAGLVTGADSGVSAGAGFDTSAGLFTGAVSVTGAAAGIGIGAGRVSLGVSWGLVGRSLC